MPRYKYKNTDVYEFVMDFVSDHKAICDVQCRIIDETDKFICIEDTMGITYNINKANLIYYSIRKIEVDK